MGLQKLVFLLCAVVVCSIAAQPLSVRSVKVSLPGVAPHSFEKDEDVLLSVNKLTSIRTQMPFDYYSLPYCKPASVTQEGENVGEVLAGDRIENSVYQLAMKQEKACEVLCAVQLSKDQSIQFVRAIDDEYRVHWIVDNLPVGVHATTPTGADTFERGFPVGFHTGKNGDASSRHYINNHIRIIVQYADDELQDGDEEEDRTSKIIGFRVEPKSLAHEDQSLKPGKISPDCKKLLQNDWGREDGFQGVDAVGTSVLFTYDVVWEMTTTPWTNRWDAYVVV